MDWRRFWKKTWYFIWESDSILSWIVNIILAFVLIKFIIYPGLGFAMQTSHPVVAVVSGSMEHKATNPCIEFNKNRECVRFDKNSYNICGKTFTSQQKTDLGSFWNICGGWYENNTAITKQDFENFKFKNGFNKGDIMVLRGVKPEKIQEGDTIVYMSKTAPYPIIHRIISTENSEDNYIFRTKGDHNPGADSPVNEEKIIGKAVVRIPLLGWIKIGFVKLVNVFTGI